MASKVCWWVWMKIVKRCVADLAVACCCFRFFAQYIFSQLFSYILWTSAANLYQLLPLLLHWLFGLKVLHPERPNATSGSRAFGPNPLHLVRQFPGRNFETLQLSSTSLQWSKHWESWGTSLAGSLMDATCLQWILPLWDWRIRRVALYRTNPSVHWSSPVSGVCPPTGAALARARWKCGSEAIGSA